MIRAILLFIVYTALVAVPPALVSHYRIPFELIPDFWLMFAFFAVVTLVVVTATIFGQNHESGRGAQFFLIFTVMKLLACMGFALLYLHQYQADGTRFLLCFFYLYLLNTVFEVYILLSNLRLQNKK